MTDILARLRSRLDDGKQRGMLAVRVDVADLEALLVIAEQPALSFVARVPLPRPVELRVHDVYGVCWCGLRHFWNASTTIGDR